MKTRRTLDEFNIGFEFEFYVKDSALVEKKEQKEEVPKEILEKYGHLIMLKTTQNQYDNYNDYTKAGKYFLKTLKESYPDIQWSKIFQTHHDGSLSDSGNKTGVEMVMKHTAGSDALDKLEKIFSVLSRSEFSTDSYCGMHVNISFVDKSKNHDNMVFSVNDLLDKDKILKLFNRSNNDYCINNDKTTIYSENFLENCTQEINKLITTQKKNRYGYNYDYTYAEIKKFRDSFNKKDTLEKFKNIIMSSIDTHFLESWGENGDRPAISPRKKRNENYLEFRMIGGKDYQKKLGTVEETIVEYLTAMKKGYMLDNKNKVRMKK